MKKTVCLTLIVLLLAACAPATAPVEETPELTAPSAILIPYDDVQETASPYTSSVTSEGIAFMPPSEDHFTVPLSSYGRYYAYFFPKEGEPQAVLEMSQTKNASYKRFVQQVLNGERALVVPCYDGTPMHLGRGSDGRITLYAVNGSPFFYMYFLVRLEENWNRDVPTFGIELVRLDDLIENLSELERYPFSAAMNSMNEVLYPKICVPERADDRTLSLSGKTVFASRTTDDTQVYYRFLYQGYAIKVYGKDDLVNEEMLSHFSLAPISEEAINDWT